MEKKKRQVAVQDVLAGWQETFCRKSQAQYNGCIGFEVLGYGFCQWTKVAFAWYGKEFYKLTRTVSASIEDEQSERKEYFHNRLVRQYLGKQNCFIEFCDFLETCEAKSMRQKVLLAAQALKLDMKTTRMYMNFYRKVF